MEANPTLDRLCTFSGYQWIAIAVWVVPLAVLVGLQTLLMALLRSAQDRLKTLIAIAQLPLLGATVGVIPSLVGDIVWPGTLLVLIGFLVGIAALRAESRHRPVGARRAVVALLILFINTAFSLWMAVIAGASLRGEVVG